MITIELQKEEAETLGRVLKSSLSQLHDEIAHTDSREYREGLKREKARIRAVLERLPAEASADAG